MPDLTVKIGQLTLKNPVMPASGCFGYGEEYAPFFDLARLGAIVVKGTTAEPCAGNPPVRLAETPAGMLNAIGLQNPGVKAAKEKIRALENVGAPVIVNVAGHSVEQYRAVIAVLEEVEAAAAYEINISCPNVKAGGMAFGTDPAVVSALVKELRSLTDKTLIIKLSPNVTDIAGIAKAAEEGGADALSLINTLLGMAIDTHTKRPVLANLTGGLSGPAVKPVALRMVWQVTEAVNIPVIGMGGISSAQDAVEFLLAGATAVAIGAANFVNPTVCPETVQGIHRYLEEEGYSSVQEIVGLAKKEWQKTGDECGCVKK
ncbi:dihydroorotate dehydrogenase [Dethiobacter alkaliphilus]|uniref:Dihydroorotate dehydrogenase n=1 Tax=Dethiobacter alkaliphilus AHT 1 TaxID=555088 RepID=C0GF14_DETAL|nr:dihydroorotate dehydrogenase [Dethiobacter alkaliphilus]EEG78196.1 dihydroorotate dehydrogenase family protein [Dethiobacter alkaliphilus AHT 1]